MSILVDKFWGEVDKSLDNIENVCSYYAGGTLCIDITPTRGVAMNLDGRGFVYGGDKIEHIHKDMRVVLPKKISDKVRGIYLKIKPHNTNYFQEKTGINISTPVLQPELWLSKSEKGSLCS